MFDLAHVDSPLHGARKVHTFITPLAQPWGLGVGIESGQFQFLAGQTGLGQKALRPFRIDLLERLYGGDPHLAWVLPAPESLGLGQRAK